MNKPFLSCFGASLLAALALSVSSCGTAQPSSALPAPNAQGEYAPSWPELGRGYERTITIHLGPDTYAYCREVSPKFSFGKAVTYVEHADQLQALASCLNHEVMRSRRVLLVGHADPRGTEAFNMGLGQRRAENIRDVLIRNGVDPSRIDVTSDGDRGAKGTRPDYAFGYDRRVDVVITGGSHAP